MAFVIRFLGLCLALTVLSACATVPKGPLTLPQQLSHPATINLPILTDDSGLMIVHVGLADGGKARFVIDTGATLSSIYPEVKTRLGLSLEARTSVRVHGMIKAQLQPVTHLSSLELGGQSIGPLRVAVISKQIEGVQGEGINAQGILGMDVLENYHLYINHPAQTLHLIPHHLGVPDVPPNWRVVELSSNPFLQDGRALHFFQLRIGVVLTPAIMDTGAQFNMMNWNINRFPKLRTIKRKLRRNWVLQGAVGSFKPVSRIKAENARAGQKFWPESEFLVFDFESLNVLGIDGKPFVIAGMPMFNQSSVLVDFENNHLYFAPKYEVMGASDEARPVGRSVAD